MYIILLYILLYLGFIIVFELISFYKQPPNITNLQNRPVFFAQNSPSSLLIWEDGGPVVVCVLCSMKVLKDPG